MNKYCIIWSLAQVDIQHQMAHTQDAEKEDLHVVEFKVTGWEENSCFAKHWIDSSTGWLIRRVCVANEYERKLINSLFSKSHSATSSPLTGESAVDKCESDTNCRCRQTTDRNTRYIIVCRAKCPFDRLSRLTVKRLWFFSSFHLRLERAINRNMIFARSISRAS